MAQLDREEIDRGLAASGLPLHEVKRTTLELHKCPEIRKFVREKQYVRKDGLTGVYIHPPRPNHSPRARLAFYLTAKEMYLSGVAVQCLSLVKLARLLDNDDDGLEEIDAANMVFLLDFFEQGAPPPLQPWQMGWVRAWLKERLDNGFGLSFYGDTALVAVTTWWPNSLIAEIAQNVREFAV